MHWNLELPKTSEKDNLDKCVVTAVKDPAHLNL
jgi:hypothetical protein